MPFVWAELHCTHPNPLASGGRHPTSAVCDFALRSRIRTVADIIRSGFAMEAEFTHQGCRERLRQQVGSGADQLYAPAAPRR